MKSRSIKQRQNTSDSQLNGTMKIEKSTHQCQGIWAKPLWDSSIKFHIKTKFASPTCHSKFLSQSAICRTRRRPPHPRNRREKNHTSCYGDAPILRTCGRQHNTPVSQLTRNWTSKTNGENKGNGNAIIRLSRNPRVSNNIIQRKRYDSSSSQWCGIRKQEKSTKPRRRTFLPIKQQQLRSEQRRNIDNVDNN